MTITALKNTLQIPRPSGSSKLTYGMPSGHVATAVFGWMMIATYTGYSPINAGILALIIMAWSRYTVGCHTVFQGIVGGLIGYGWFSLFQL